MNPDFAAEVQARLMSLRQFMSACPPTLHGARLVHYCGADFRGALDVAVVDIESQVANSVGEGFLVDWVCRNEVLYLRVAESDAPRPSWERVFAEDDLGDVRALLRDADFDSNA
jgi:hypothetical protein